MTKLSMLVCVLATAAIAACSSNSSTTFNDAPYTNPPGPTGVQTVPLTTPDGAEYITPFTISGSAFAMKIDTSVATTAVADASCASCKTAGVTPLYTPPASAMDQMLQAMAMNLDGTDWTGEVYQDAVTLGHDTPDGIQLQFASIQSQDGFFTDNSYQGVLGLGPSESELGGTGSYVAYAASAGEEPIYSFQLCPDKGTMWLAGFDATAIGSGTMTYTPQVPVDPTANPFYAVNVDAVSVDGQDLGFATTDFDGPIFDTDTPTTFLPTPIFTAVLAAINADAGYKTVFGDSVLSDTGSGCVTATGATQTKVDTDLPVMAFSLPSIDGSPDFQITPNPSQSYLYDGGDGTWCLGIADGGSDSGTILGTEFMSAFVTVIDLQHTQIGFAPEVGCAAESADIHRAVRHTRKPQVRRARHHH